MPWLACACIVGSIAQSIELAMLSTPGSRDGISKVERKILDCQTSYEESSRRNVTPQEQIAQCSFGPILSSMKHEPASEQ